MSLKSTIKSGLNVKAIIGVVVGIVLFNLVKTKFPQIS